MSAVEQTPGQVTDGLRERCRKMIDTLQRDAMLRQNNPVETLMSFVLAERGRELMVEGVMPLVLYFPDAVERDEFIAIWRAEHPNSITRKVP